MTTPSTHRKNDNAQLELGTVGTTGQKYDTNHNAISSEIATFPQPEAKFAQAGHTLRQKTTPDGTIYYLASRWCRFRDLRGLEAAAAFLAVVGGL